jgi:uncharacterized coiled-coil protein SlyX
MATQEERLTNLENTVAFLQKQTGGFNLRDLNRDLTTVFGMASRQELDIQDMKTSLARIETNTNKRLDSLGQTLAVVIEKQEEKFHALDNRLEAFEQNTNKRFDAIDSRFASVDSRFDAFEQSVNSRFDAVDSRFDRIEMLLAQVIARLPEQP